MVVDVWESHSLWMKFMDLLRRERTLAENLEESDVIRTYTRYGGVRKETVYQLVDFFSSIFLMGGNYF